MSALTLDIFVNPPAEIAGDAQRHALCDILRLATIAEQLDHSTFWVTEHHTAEGGLTPSPLILLAAIAMVTTRQRLGTAACLVGLTDARRLAEEAALVDAISGGRLELGLARGFDERAFRDAGRQVPDPDTFGEQVAEVEHQLTVVVPRPVQKRLPVWMAASSPDSAERAAEAGLPVLLNPYFTGRRERFTELLERYVDAGGCRVFAHVPVHVHDGTVDGAEEGDAGLASYLRRHGPGFTVDGLVDAGMVAVGSAEAVAEHLRWLAGLGVERVGLNPLLGFLPLDAAVRTLEGVARDVRPLLAPPGAGPTP